MDRPARFTRTDLLEFETAADLLAHYAELHKRTGTRRRWMAPKPVVEETPLPPPLPPQEPSPAVLIRRTHIERVIYETCFYYGITRAVMISPSRFTTVLIPRSVAMFLAKELLRDHAGGVISLPTLGRIFRRDHSSVLNSIRNIADKVDRAHADYDPAVANAVEILRDRLK